MDCESEEAIMKGLFTTCCIIVSSCLLLSCNQANNLVTESVDAPITPVIQTTINVESQVISKSVFSNALDKEMSVSIYLPPGYNPATNYPVLYLLYGYGGTHDSWFTGLHIDSRADELIQSDQIQPLIIVSPDYGNSFAVNTKPGEGVNPGGVDVGNYAEYIVQDLVSFVDSEFSTITTKDGRYIGGASMGGYGALYLGFTYPELFSKVGGHSSAIWTYTTSDQFTDQRDWLYANDDLRRLRDPFMLAKNNSLHELQVYLDAGEQDLLVEKNQSLFEVLEAEGMQSEFHPSPGGHDYSYWVGQLDNYLKFYAGK
jgi:enterochelin esterase-like enzyme